MPNGSLCICFGKSGSSYKKMGGGGSARPPSMDVTSYVGHTSLDNTFVCGSGIGATNIFIRSAQKRALSQSMRCVHHQHT